MDMADVMVVMAGSMIEDPTRESEIQVVLMSG